MIKGVNMSSKVAKHQETKAQKKENRAAKRKRIVAGIVAGFLVLAMVASMVISAFSGLF